MIDVFRSCRLRIELILRTPDSNKHITSRSRNFSPNVLNKLPYYALQLCLGTVFLYYDAVHWALLTGELYMIFMGISWNEVEEAMEDRRSWRNCCWPMRLWRGMNQERLPRWRICHAQNPYKQTSLVCWAVMAGCPSWSLWLGSR